MTTRYRADDTNAFGNHLLTIELDTSDFDEDVVITKVEIQCGMLTLPPIENPVFPLTLDLNAQQTKQLQNNNPVYLRVYDEEGLRQTCEGSIEFPTQKEVVYG